MVKPSLLLALALAPIAASAQSFQSGRIPAANRDSFAVIYQGQPIGAFIMSHTKTGDTVTLTAEARLPAMGVSQLDSIVFHATTFSPSLITTTSTMMGTSGGARVTIANGKATGMVNQPSAGGAIQKIPIDAVVAPGVIADGAEAVLIPTLDFSEGMTMNFQTFDPKSAKTKSYVLKVVGKETVTVPAGSIESWKVELVSDESVTVWVSVADPKRLVMLRLEGAQMEMKRASK
jgi:hypothetical protein